MGFLLLADAVFWPILVGLGAIIVVGIAVLVAIGFAVRLLIKRRRDRVNNA